MGLLNTIIVTAMAFGVPRVQGGPNERRPLEFFGICNIISGISCLGFFGVAEHEYRDGTGLRDTWCPWWTV